MQDADGWNIISQMPNAFSSGGCHNEIEQPLSSACDTDAAHVEIWLLSQKVLVRRSNSEEEIPPFFTFLYAMLVLFKHI